MSIVNRQPNFFSTSPRTSMVRISETWPRLMTGMIQLPGMPTPPAAALAPRNDPVQLKYRLWTNASMKVMSHRTRTKGCLSSLTASSQAKRSADEAPATFFFGGV